jgi:L-amino acid N-acyltransferase YncA
MLPENGLKEAMQMGISLCEIATGTILKPESRHSHQANMPSIRPSRETDTPAIADIYSHYVLHGSASFEAVPPSVKEMARRRDDVLNRALPHLVAEIGQTVIGYAYAVPYRSRDAYRFTVEDSVYVHPNHAGKGVGRLLLTALIEACEKTLCRQMIAVIGGRDNIASISLHRALGFRDVGVLKSVGFKFGAWVDTVLMQRELGAGNSKAPD